MEEILKVSIRASVISCLIFLLCFHQVTEIKGQLDLPSMPGPPYPDPRGQNRWGVKFDPRKHGPPYDKREGPTGSSHNRNIYRRPPNRHRDNQNRFREKDSYWSPARLRRHRRHRRPKSQRHTRYYGNDLNRRRPRTHLKAYKHNQNLPSKVEEQQFWNSWNAWYKKHEKHNQGKKVVKATEGWKAPEKEQIEEGGEEEPITFHIDLNDLKGEGGYEDDDDSEEERHKEHKYNFKNNGRNKDSGYGGRWKERRDYYLKRMKEAMNKAKSFVSFEETDDQGEKGKSQSDREQGWRMFTTIGKGLDAASGAMSSVRKTVGGSVLATGMKYGGKMAVDAVMNVGTSALTKAIKTATPFL